ncbi:chromate transporter [Xylophilus ampelinus]|uniref:Chromate transporter n=1 Tax=Xylophilus ampelinus TaxID=54067 RepID=A0A318SLS4_9BURK|nr:chromate transporter [Xylophilus ampelinus]MCS4509008.1 chromate transporter [Xylophilus ampelinus]PYE79966.1 chromate transporter [Xylophilus ampelinus]
MMGATLSTADWLALFVQFMALSLVSVSGAIGTVPDMHRYLVDQEAWLTDPQFSASIAIAQAAPGPNVLFVALLGWNVGVNSAGGMAAGPHAWALGAAGVLITMVGILLPSGVLTYSAARWLQHNRHRRAVRAFKQGMGPVVVGLLMATGWVLVSGGSATSAPWAVWATAIAAALVVWRTRLHLLWVLGAGALLGGLGWI